MKKAIRNTLIGTGLVAAHFGLGNLGPKRHDCETYQGYRVEPEGGIVYVFDSLPIEERTLDARLPVEGKESLIDSLLNGENIGKRFCVNYVDPIYPLSNKKIRNVYRDF